MPRCLVCASDQLLQIAHLSDIPHSAQPFVDDPVPPTKRSEYTISLSAYQCQSCSHVQADCPRVPYYKDVITASSLSPTILKMRDDNIHTISQLLKKNNPSIFEIGAYKGQYLSHLRRRGYSHLQGLEHSHLSCAQSDDPCINLQQGYLLDPDLALSSENCFDLILCFNFLEHIPQPFEFLQVIKARLAASSAYLYLTMPNFEYIRSHNLLQELVPDHISYFTLQSLKTLFQRCNLDIISLKAINNSNDLEIIAHHQQLQISPLDPLCLENLSRSLDAILLNAFRSEQSVAFWGAGHRSLTLISQLHYAHISCIVDSADFKQGKYCPDTGLQIISPSHYYQSTTDILILSLPGIYANEVAAQLGQSEKSPNRIYSIHGNELHLIK